jgi:hypothetical protein
MTARQEDNSTSVSKLIFVPFLISLAITLLRLVGELQHWPVALFNPAAGGGGAVVGISWLVPIFGIYFAVKLARAGDGPPSSAKAILFALLAIVVFATGGFILGKFGAGPVSLLGFLMFLCAAVIPAAGWKDLFRVLFAYAFSARIPVAILMFFAIQGDWHTHYDVAPPNFPADVGTMTKFLEIGLLPQLTLWIGFTVAVGALFGSVVAALLPREKKVPQPA